MNKPLLEIERLVVQYGWADIAEKTISREGIEVETGGDVWHLPYSIYKNTSINFLKIENIGLRWCVKRYIQDRLQSTSAHAAYVAFTHLWAELFSHYQDIELNISAESIEESLIELLEKTLSQARAKHRLWAMYRIIQWYIWSAENYPELGFSLVYATELDSMTIPGNPKGEAVRMEDPDKGPLHRTLELPLLIKAMRDDKSVVFEHLQQKAALALSIAFGRNPANLTYLKATDLVNLIPDSEESCYLLRMPRIKKRQLNPRDDLLDEYLDSEYARYILDLVQASSGIEMTIDTGKGILAIERPLFINVKMNAGALAAQQWGNAFNMTAVDIGQLLKSFVCRHNIVSPLTGELLCISPRRLRYTLATGLAAEGISRQELARILDHTDTQHVHVYFEMAGNIVEHLDKATAKGFTRYLDFFKGKVIETDEEAINGDREDKHLAFINESDPTDQAEIGICGEANVCHLDPPYSCYLCPKFQPYRHANHEHVLDCLLENREERMEKYESARLGIQLDQVIAAVAQVVEMCAKELAYV